ncbi:MAG: hypothetical protein PHC28_16235 [Flavobacterium sp.]|uniref:hypothetical protein n=1 Tax=Flavobacterium sp. TaxID=239 RepID=UPI0026274073|nr:hypothetical protein [Flavobacterium sp.]MDD5152002.1 hypothetical protein [Flavobacterium sp.]
MKKIIFFIALIFISCNNDNNDKIVLTSGISMNPAEPRFGIEIKRDTLYYCEEIINNKGNYNYYKSEIDSKILSDLRNGIQNEFKKNIENKSIEDATPFELYTCFDNNIKKNKFYFSSFSLNKNQIKVIKTIIKLKELKMEKIESHSFPNELLTEKLPEPPLPRN